MCNKLDNKFYEIIESKILDDSKKIKSEFRHLALNNKKPVKCEDETVAIVEITNDKCVYVVNNIITTIKGEKRNEINSEYDKLQSIVLILESPHKSEFNEQHESLGPARGKTGENIDKFFLRNIFSFIHFNDLENQGTYLIGNKTLNGKYKLVLMNAIQYQCSLGNLSGNECKDRRNTIFKECFNKVIDGKNIFKNDFIKRLKKYKPAIIINCCTGQNEGEISGLQEIVQNIINNDYKNDCLKLYGCHPSSPWFLKGFKKYRKYI